MPYFRFCCHLITKNALSTRLLPIPLQLRWMLLCRPNFKRNHPPVYQTETLKIDRKTTSSFSTWMSIASQEGIIQFRFKFLPETRKMIQIIEKQNKRNLKQRTFIIHQANMHEYKIAVQIHILDVFRQQYFSIQVCLKTIKNALRIFIYILDYFPGFWYIFKYKFPISEYF